ncbi:L-asparaginase [Drosophila subobscura]|uniref:L-asparaginase n=1 Tax=Drosophila subobscura TaxID=7241 RepID=UPI00155B170A|nr:L-asparaginase [Drosophila subobscura]
MPAKNCECRKKKEVRVHVIYVGGTIGMMRNASGVLAPAPKELTARLREYPNCHDKEYKSAQAENASFMVLPVVEGTQCRVLYDLVEYCPLLDSSCMGCDEWKKIAKDVGNAYKSYDGFVILHGTDTLAYTASALAFMLENLNKPVVVTGAQIPIFEARTDGRDNFLGSLLLAGIYNIPEVLVFFGNKILRGCRTSKINANSFHAFDSPNQPPLGQTGIKIEINNRQIFRPCSIGDFSVHCCLERNVGILRFYPGITPAVICAFLREPMKGVVLQSFGSGNIPANQEEILDVLREAVGRGVLVVNTSQCSTGLVSPIYECGHILTEIGVIPGYDLTPEAALTKLAYVLGKCEWDLANKKKVMLLSLRGELTTKKLAKINDIDLIEGVARTLHMSSSVEREQMCSIFYPALVSAAVMSGDVEKLGDLKQYGANLCDENCDGRTALHLACYLGKLNCVSFLLAVGCNVNVHDRFNRTPLHEAVDTDNHAVIKALLCKGAVLSDPPEVQAELLRALTERGKTKRMESWRLAGADLSLADRTGRTALHYACQLGNHEVVDYLLPFYKNPYVKDELDMTPIDYAKAAHHDHIVTLLRFREKNDQKDPCACIE